MKSSLKHVQEVEGPEDEAGDDELSSSSQYEEGDDEDDGDETLPSTDAASSSKEGRRGRQRKQEKQEAEREIRDKISKKENRRVHQARLLTIFAISACAASLAVAIYYFAKNTDEASFESAFTDFSDHIVEFVQWETTYNFALIEHEANVVTLTAAMTNQTFPYVTHPHFEVNGGYVDGMGGIMAVFYAPLINGSDASRQEWQDYAMANRGWVNTSKFLKKAHPGHRDPLHGTMQDHEDDRRRRLQEQPPTVPEALPNISSTIYRWNEADGQQVPVVSDETTILAPLWQSSPANADAINVDLLSDERIANLYKAMMATKHRSVMSATTEITYLFDFLFDENEKPQKKKPHAFLMEPVYANFVSANDTDQDLINKEPVGFLLGITVYENLLDRHFIPEGLGGIIAVIRDTCGHDLTYQLDGPEAIFLGHGDLHDPAFDEYVRFTPIEHYHIISPSQPQQADSETDPVQNNDQVQNATKEAADLSGLCRHELFLYPSAEFQSSYQTDTPMIYTLVIILAFTATATFFFIYDICASRRQEKTMKSALRTTAIISSLFPAAMRDRLLEEHDKKEKDKKEKEQHDDKNKNNRKNGDVNNKKGKNGPNNQSKTVPRASSTSNKQGEQMSSLTSSITTKSRPIADFFPDTTLLFADIVGFTAWSSKREPRQVFQLLETLYGEFDTLAKKRRVFKVETVGDCYVAACGLPEPRKDHAIVMARFARDMHVKAHQVLQKLATADGGGLGPDTAHLCFRVGLHSGAVMGGVLRGDNARFQLFGDAMNTAARMEHTGLANRTHISATTAELLIAAGKQNWITPREEKTIAKGLGELSTYWLHSMSNRASGSTADGQSQNNDQTSSGADDYTTGQMEDDVTSDIDENEGRESKTTTSSHGVFLDRPEYIKTCSTAHPETDTPSPSTTTTD